MLSIAQTAPLLRETRIVVLRTFSTLSPVLANIKSKKIIANQSNNANDPYISEVKTKKQKSKLIPGPKKRSIDVNKEIIPTSNPDGETVNEMVSLVEKTKIRKYKETSPSPKMIDKAEMDGVFQKIEPKAKRAGLLSEMKPVPGGSKAKKVGLLSKMRQSGTFRTKAIRKRRGYTQLESHSYWTSQEKTMNQSVPLKSENIPTLAHNLDRVLFSPGVHYLQDPRTRVYNFDPFLKNVISHKDFKFEAIQEFKPASRDKVLLEHAKKVSAKFYSSTSSMTSLLTKFYMLLNYYDGRVERFGDVPFNGLTFNLASSIIVKPQGSDRRGNTIYSMESDRSCDTEFLLSSMGMCLETLLTNPEDEFVKYHKSNDAVVEQQPNVYNYATYGDFLMRSQLDCYDERLPGNGTFDLKTRAALSIRSQSHKPGIENTNYQIWKQKGKFESFEREFRDMIRTGALMKYMFQARIGQMDGIFVAYHNVSSIFGFQYLPLQALDEIYYNNPSFENYLSRPSDEISEDNIKDIRSKVADRQFQFSLDIWQKLLNNHILKDLKDPNQPFRLVAKDERHGSYTTLKIFVHPISNKEADEIQKFPNQFVTSFKAKGLTHKSRLQNLKTHSEELKNFNQKIAKNRKILRYNIGISQGAANGRVFHPSRLPRDPDDWKIQYTIIVPANNQTSVSKKKYLKHLDEIADVLVKDKSRSRLQDLLDTYERVGEIRKKIWDEQESKVGKIVYSPK
ncbi:mRNA degradation protein [Spathaspora sp. JA1]|nr:mRNA degradation protein [Spathaspora sp. JA1]